MTRVLSAMTIALLAGTAATAQDDLIVRQPEAGTVVYAEQTDGPGAAHYGAEDEADRTVKLQVAGLFAFEPPITVEISPWHRVQGFQGDRPIHNESGIGHVENGGDGYYSNAYTRGLRAMANRIEKARQRWLSDNGYVGAVRTFGSAGNGSGDEQTSLPEPRGIIRVPDRIKNQKSRFQVDAGQSSDAVVTFGRLTRVGVATVVGPDEAEQVASK